MTTPQEFVAPKLRAKGPVRITLPAKVAYDPKALKESIASIVERLGCPECFSGASCLFEMERDFVVCGSISSTSTSRGWESSNGSSEEWYTIPTPSSGRST